MSQLLVCYSKRRTNVHLNRGSRADVSLTNDSRVLVAAGGGGDIAIHARNTDLSEGVLSTGIALGLGTTGSQAGDITLDATEAIALTNGARLIRPPARIEKGCASRDRVVAQ